MSQVICPSCLATWVTPRVWGLPAVVVVGEPVGRGRSGDRRAPCPVLAFACIGLKASTAPGLRPSQIWPPAKSSPATDQRQQDLLAQPRTKNPVAGPAPKNETYVATQVRPMSRLITKSPPGDSNPQPLDYKSSALPVELGGRCGAQSGTWVTAGDRIAGRVLHRHAGRPAPRAPAGRITLVTTARGTSSAFRRPSCRRPTRRQDRVPRGTVRCCSRSRGCSARA
jgi:hypothetical protein